MRDHLTRVLSVDPSQIGDFVFEDPRRTFLADWTFTLSDHNDDAANLQEAASQIRSSDVPVAFPTETVYGLGADARRGPAVRGIYSVKQRPADNPLIVHICSLGQLRRLLNSQSPVSSTVGAMGALDDPIPSIYHPLISKFWPGPLTLILPLPTPSPFASEVTTKLPSFGVRMPSSRLALALIYLAGAPLAAPSANTSTRPSPTAASHVLHDLKGRIDLILDGGPCAVGLESTVVDGMTQPPVILRPGGVSIEELRECPGWEDVRVGYKVGMDTGIPKAPGMKYKHYSPKARLVLVHGEPNLTTLKRYLHHGENVGLLMTELEGQRSIRWSPSPIDLHGKEDVTRATMGGEHGTQDYIDSSLFTVSLDAQYYYAHWGEGREHGGIDVWEVRLGPTPADVARGLFSALRYLDQKDLDTIFVQSIDEYKGGAAAAVMNRLRKAAECEVQL